MESPGEYLKRERELRGTSLAAVYEAIRVPKKYLNALEADEYDALPHPTFVKGFIKSYCRHLGLDETEAVLKYEMYIRERAERAAETSRREAPAKKGFFPGITPAMSKERLYVAAAAAFAVMVAVFYFVATRKASAPPSVQTTAVQEPEALPQSAPAPDAAPNPPYPPLVKGGVGGVGHTLDVKATELVWIKIRIDNGEPFDVILHRGERIVWKARDAFSLVVGNAGGVEMTYDGMLLKPFGKSGEVVNFKLPAGDPSAKNGA
ncbi:MAG: helix-turn-helix domain-containing protein [Deltaproteobacteria bacterium]|nr:helix-turn-helix domain-containing protein [Deltaproteobacteria bacterium]